MELQIKNLDEINTVAKEFVNALGNRTVVAFYGKMGVGKTTFIKAVCEHVGNRAYAYEPINEPHMWVEFARNPQGYFCFCEETRKCFRLWLQKR